MRERQLVAESERQNGKEVRGEGSLKAALQLSLITPKLYL